MRTLAVIPTTLISAAHRQSVRGMTASSETRAMQSASVVEFRSGRGWRLGAGGGQLSIRASGDAARVRSNGARAETGDLLIRAR
jgi:hypothetical protein